MISDKNDEILVRNMINYEFIVKNEITDKETTRFQSRMRFMIKNYEILVKNDINDKNYEILVKKMINDKNYDISVNDMINIQKL